MVYMIKGGEFNNKGAEAMTLVLIKNIYEYDNDAIIYMAYQRGLAPFEFVRPIQYFEVLWKNAKIEIEGTLVEKVKMRIKEFIKMFMPSKISYLRELKNYKEVLKKVDVLFDISGYQLGDKWGEETAINYCDCIRLVKQYGAKVFLMPQSFGPFNFSNDVLEYIASTLKKCDLIFAREKKGFDELLKMKISNVKLSYDSVLTEKDFTPYSVIKNYDDYVETVNLHSKKNISVIPNSRLFDKGTYDKMEVIQKYCELIECAISDEFDVYLIPHAGEDIDICNEIKTNFLKTNRVYCFDHVMYSFNYERLMRNMNFVIASRYHSIVHAYKVGTPAVIIGWSDKYEELASAFGQEGYIVNSHDLEMMIDAYRNMSYKYAEERKIIVDKLATIQKDNCYKYVFSNLK